MTTLQQLIKNTIELHTIAPVNLLNIKLLPAGPQGYSGGLVRYFEVTWALVEAGATTQTWKFVVKEAPLLERQVITLLNRQKQPGIPLAFADDLQTDKPLSQSSGAGQPPVEATFEPEEEASGLVCMQFLENKLPADSRKVAEALAALHFANLGQRPDWLPLAARPYIEDYIIGEIYRPHWQAALEIPEFQRDYGHLTEPLEQAAQRFSAFNEMLWQEGTSLTLTHADLHNQHVLTDAAGQPYFIDWGQARYGSFYLDLPNYFSLEQALDYRAALARNGLEIGEAEFKERYTEAGRYAGFKYMSFCLWSWQTFEPKYDASRLALLKVALNGGYGMAQD